MSDERKAYTRLTDAQWKEAGVLWERGEASLSQLSERFGAREETISRGLKARGYEKGAKAEEHAKAVGEEVEKGLLDDATELAKRIRETKEQHYRYAESLAKLIMKEIVQAQRQGHPVGVAMPNIKTLRQALSALQIARNERWAVLGLDKDDTSPDDLEDLVVSVLGEDEVRKIQESSGDLGDEDMMSLDEIEEGVEEEGTDDG